MTIATLRTILIESGFREDCFYIGDDLTKSKTNGIGCTPVLLRTKGEYEIFDAERGGRSGVRHFTSEDEACTEFLKDILYYGDGIRSHTLGATMARDKADALMNELVRQGIRVSFNIVRRGDHTYPWYTLTVYWSDRERAKPIVEKANLEWKM